MSNKLNHPLPWILALIAGGVIVVGTTTYVMFASPSDVEKVEKLTEAVTVENLRVKIEASGTVEPIQSVNVSPKNPGRLARLLVEQGSIVKKGQPLAIMENQEIQAQGIEAQARVKQAIASYEEAKQRIPSDVNQAKARYNQAIARYNQAIARYNQFQASLDESKARLPEQIRQYQAQVVAAQSQLQLSQERLKRYQALYKDGAVGKDQLDQFVNQFQDAEAKLFEAQRRFDESKNTANPEIGQIEAQLAESKLAVNEIQAQIAEAKLAVEEREKTANQQMAQLAAAVQAAQAQLKLVEVQFRDTLITAPFDGIVTQKYATVGAFVTPTTSASNTASATSTSIVALAQGLEIIAKVPEVDISRLIPGQPVEIRADAFPDQVFQGKVKRIAPEAIVEQNVTSFEVTIELVKGKEQLRSKMNVDVTFLGQQLANAFVIPTVAIVTEKGETGVLVPNKENKPEFKAITLGATLGDKTQVISGLLPGDRVFTDLPKEYRDKIKEEKSEN